MAIEREYDPDREPSHPGAILSDYMEADDWNQTELAEIMEVSRPHLNEIINGKRGISPRMALKLSIVFDTTARFWMNLNQARELWEARQEEPYELDAIRERLQERNDAVETG